MSKADNLTEFLTGIAGKLRTLLGETAKMSPQTFEEKIQAVYNRGLANGGPAAGKITAAAKDVRKGKVFGSGGPNTLTGTMDVTTPDCLASSGSGSGHKLTSGVLLGSYTGEEYEGKQCLYMQVDNESYLDNVRYYMAEADTVAEAIKLTGDKLVSGQTVLGVVGTGRRRVETICTIGTGNSSYDPECNQKSADTESMTMTMNGTGRTVTFKTAGYFVWNTTGTEGTSVYANGSYAANTLYEVAAGKSVTFGISGSGSDFFVLSVAFMPK